MADCPGSCNSRARRDQATYKAALVEWDQAMENRAEGEPEPPRPVPPDIRPWPGDPIWCLKCSGTLGTQLAELDDLAALIAATPPLAKPPDDGAGRVAGTRDAKSPSARMDELEELGEWLRSWEAAAREADDPRPRRGYLATESTTVTAWLYHHFPALIMNPDCALDFGEEIRRWHRELSRLASAGRMNRHQKRPCPRCKLYTLWLTVGDNYIRCINEDCNRLLSREEYDALADVA